MISPLVVYYPICINFLIANQEFDSKRTQYPALKNLLDYRLKEVETAMEEKANKPGIPNFAVRKLRLLVGYMETKELGREL